MAITTESTADIERLTHIVNFSGGASSYVAARRVIEHYGKDRVKLICADTGNEAADWHDFVHLAADNLDAELIIVKNDRYKDIWDNAMQRKMLPSIFRGFCTIEHKVQPINNWIMENTDPKLTVQYFGYDFTELHRLKKVEDRFQNEGRLPPQAPLIWEPILSKFEVLDILRNTNLPMPECYDLGITHNNCLATGCFKQGQAAWKTLLRVKPEVYAYNEAKEQEFIKHINKPEMQIGIIYRKNKTLNAEYEVLTLKEFRENIEAQGELFAVDNSDYGACNCFED